MCNGKVPWMLKVHHVTINANKESLFSGRVNLLYICRAQRTHWKTLSPNDKSTFLNLKFDLLWASQYAPISCLFQDCKVIKRSMMKSWHCGIWKLWEWNVIISSSDTEKSSWPKDVHWKRFEIKENLQSIIKKVRILLNTYGEDTSIGVCWFFVYWPCENLKPTDLTWF